MNKFIHDSYQELLDLSNLKISSHALSQYIIKCDPFVNIIEVPSLIRNALKNVAVYRKNDESILYTDGNNIFVTKENTVVTIYPKNRIFKAKIMYRNKKTGYKWL